ncbi:AAA family ATPase [uncultured Peptoniphilus sp.]|uniref:AAA family ATPase n=1 Tax=uncultured Peptoniphilus sp. TaxID=254354 RepID=UPI0035A5A5FB
MKIKNLLIKNYKLLKSVIFDINEGLNIFVGGNESCKSTILEVFSIIASTKRFKRGSEVYLCRSWL